MNIDTRAILEKVNHLEEEFLYDKGCASSRRHKDLTDPLSINPFVTDEANLLSSKVFRVMDQKTQVFTQPQNPLVRNRKNHVLEVQSNSVMVSKFLGLNTNLVRAAAIGHDIGHVPYGHPGEAWMQKAMGKPNFCHEVMGPIIAQKIERKGVGLNLTWDTLDAMMRHSGNMAREGMSQEAWLLRYIDKVTYLFHDVNDIFIRMKYPIKHELKSLVDMFGEDQRSRTRTAVCGLIFESAACGHVSFEHSDLARAFKRLRELMLEVYVCVTEQKIEGVMEPILNFLQMIKVGDPFLILALMTDKDVIELSRSTTKDMAAFNRTAVSEIVPYLQEIGPIDLCDPCLNW